MTPDSTQPRARPWRWWLLALGVWLVLAAVAVLALWHLRREAVASEGREVSLLSLTLTDEIDRGLQGAEVGLRAVRDEIAEGRLQLNDIEATPSLRTRASLMPLLRTLWVVDRDWQVLAASNATPAPDRALFAPALLRPADDVLAISRPFPGPDAGVSLVALVVALPEAPGRPGGWIVGAMPASALLGPFPDALTGRDWRVAVTRSDGARLASVNLPVAPRDEAGLATALATRPVLEVRRFGDGSQRLVGLHSVPRYAIRVTVSLDLTAVLAAWRGAAQLTAAALALLFAIVAAAIHLVLQADRRRSVAQDSLQAQLARASKLESLGTLAGGVAHDFNNVLAGILGFGEMAQDAAVPGSAQARHLDKVVQAALRGKALVERILSFSRGGARLSTVFELEPVVDEVLTLLSASLRPGVVLERALEAHGARVRGDPTQAFEAVMNLCTNAMQAMSAGGMLSVQLSRVHVATPRVLSHTQLAAGDWVALSVSDQGAGITPEVMEHLFEPFFTTRAAQSGTGLGLAVVFGVVAEIGGAIDVKSTPGQGARFTLYVPECTDASNAAAAGSTTVPTGSGQPVLVVDDDPDLVALAVELLSGLGYAPVGFDNSPAALEAVCGDPTRFAAVVTDEVMPDLTGTQLTQALRPLAPDLPVLLVSGYGGAALARRAAAAGVTRVLGKPLQRVDLARALSELLR